MDDCYRRLRAMLLGRRRSMGLTQQEAADAANMSREMYGKVEGGTRDPGIGVLCGICTALGIPVREALSLVADELEAAGMAPMPRMRVLNSAQDHEHETERRKDYDDGSSGEGHEAEHAGILPEGVGDREHGGHDGGGPAEPC